MSKYFLKGNFLPAYGSKLGVVDYGPMKPQIAPDQLAQRFEARSKRYQARGRSYLQGIQIGLAGALLIAIGIFSLDIAPGASDSVATTEQEVVQMEEIVQTRQLEKPPPPPRPPVPVEVPNDELLESDELDLDAFLDLDEPLADLPPPPPVPVAREEAEAEPELFYIVEEMPELIGGVAAIARSLDYPEIARKAGIEGIVVIQIQVNPDGTPSNPQILRSVATVLDNAALEAVMKQSFKPGRQRGRAVTVAMNIPVTFRLS